MQFRYDINGLRAIAVIAVVIFHFNPEWLPGGFAGVDVFFVISGFLMTSIIFNGIENNTFNLFKFYTSRANRIIPVLSVLAIVLLIFGWFYLLPSDYQYLAKQVEKSIIFTSNILFSTGGGYFDTNEKTKWLLHTWTLSVEWQFYIFYPLLIVFLKKFFNISKIKKIILALCILSFIYCVFSTYKNPISAYFLISSRAWEMLLGGLAFLFPFTIRNIKIATSLQILGIILIIFSYFLISEATPWPGYLALLPVIGTYLIISSNIQNNPLINNIIFRNIGKWSYSIYVWHWPIVILGVYFSISNWWLYGIPLSIFLGFISYQVIERKKLPTFQSWKEIYKVKPLYMVVFIFLAADLIKKTNGMEWHYSNTIIEALNEIENTNPYKCDDDFQKYNYKLLECKIGNQENIKAIVIGDSHADALTTAVLATLDLKKEGIVSIIKFGCPFILNARNNMDKDQTCYKENNERIKALKKYEGIPIISIARWSEKLQGETDPERIRGSNTPEMYFGNTPLISQNQMFNDFEKNLKLTVCSVKKHSPVYLMQPLPEMNFNVPKTIGKNFLFGKQNADLSITLTQYLDRASDVRNIIKTVADKCGAKIIDPTEILCKSGKCIAQYNGRSIYRDGDHMSEYGNKLLTPMFKEALNLTK
ncbi:acyltransferase family protein [Acinetobacter sp. ANC 4648]|uniref:acyltransferase family protein n=1 Tax=Acinetobacter sp. ANC 4648 TaxID=1977875 RepID=UPI000A346D51|nr:acyltransferase family protein [Acinetobacter sp. ANC 4648]OTG82390.1 acyltransferase [Acinetobacter sp. ANC 4648]